MPYSTLRHSEVVKYGVGIFSLRSDVKFNL